MNKLYIVIAFLLTILAAYLKQWVDGSALINITLQIFVYGIPSAIICYTYQYRLTMKGCLCIALFFATLFVLLGINFPYEYLRANYLFILTVLVVAPLCEELFFRGFVYKFITDELGKSPKYSILFSAMIFSIFHINPISMLAAFVSGIGLAYILYKFKSLSLCIMAHSGYNLAIFLMINY